MAKDLESLEREILETFRRQTQPADPSELFTQGGPAAGQVRQALRSLLNRGDLDMTLDWRLRAHSSDENPDK